MKHDKSPRAIIEMIVHEKIRFNQVLGITLESMSEEQVCLKFPMSEKLVGNFVHGSLHGGVISATLDVAGGVMSFVGAMREIEPEFWQEKVADKFARLGTIDLRIDYLRPGIGEQFFATASLLRVGNKVAVARMELHNEQQHLISVGTGTYIIG